jgi:hypothetical protein
MPAPLAKQHQISQSLFTAHRKPPPLEIPFLNNLGD